MIAQTMRWHEKRFAHLIDFSWTSADTFRRSLFIRVLWIAGFKV